MTRDDLSRFSTLSIDFESISLMEPSVPQPPYFCDPENAEYVGRTGCDGIHFILLPGDERIFCVDPAMGEPGTYVLPVAENFQEFLSFVLFCRDTNPLAQIRWLTEEHFRKLLAEDAAARWDGCDEYFARKAAALDAIAGAFPIRPQDPYAKVKALQAGFDPAGLHFGDEYYDTLDLERP